MPFGKEDFETDFSLDLDGDQGCPLLVSNKGRFIWSEAPFYFSFENDKLKIYGEKLEYGYGFNSLSDVHLGFIVNKKYRLLGR
ncbi:hypothetical protein AB1K84_12990 [Mesobacillus foraminis]|uniref:hypothetical protein n=1 Tax=Mesobacillus foraminis TaxID=279826 RepID=UPI00399F2E43